MEPIHIGCYFLNELSPVTGMGVCGARRWPEGSSAELYP